MVLDIPELALVILMGPSGSGKSTFASKHFKPTEILSSDFCRGLICDDKNNQDATKDAVEVLHVIARKRLAMGKITVVDAVNVRPEDREPLVALAREFHCVPVAIIFDLPAELCRQHNRTRNDRDIASRVVVQQADQLRQGLRGLKREGFRHIHRFCLQGDVESAVVERQPLYCNLKHEYGPFDIIGDVHGCCGELEELLGKLGYEIAEKREGQLLDGGPVFRHPQGRKPVFLGDLVDRGPRALDTIRLASNMVRVGAAICLPGNHDMRLVRLLRGTEMELTFGLDKTVDELQRLPDNVREEFSRQAADFLGSLVSHAVLYDGKLVVAHAGMKEQMQGRDSTSVREFALAGETTGETDEFGLPIRYDWAARYGGRATVVYGHTSVFVAEWVNNTLNIDTGCVFGRKLTALRYPEMELVSVPAKRPYYRGLQEPSSLSE